MSGSRSQNNVAVPNRFSIQSISSGEEKLENDAPCMLGFKDGSWVFILQNKRLGEGAQGSVYLGEYQQSLDCPQSQAVAVKIAESDEVDKTEYSVMSALSAKKSPYLLNMLAYGCDSQRSVIVIEYMQTGSLDGVIGTDIASSWKERLQIVTDSISGLADMHELGYLHRDVKSANILLDSKLRAKLCDFGMSCQENADEAKEVAGSLTTIAPEILQFSVPSTKKSDIYSFGVVLLEIAMWSQDFTDKILEPQHNDTIRAIYEFASSWPLRLQILNEYADRDCPTDIARLVHDCTQADSKNRPAAEDVKNRLMRMNEVHSRVSQVFFKQQGFFKLDPQSDKIAGLVREYAEEEQYFSPTLK